MSEELMAVCSTGHTIKNQDPSSHYNRIVETYTEIENWRDIATGDQYLFTSKIDYCKKCGREIHTQCSNCGCDIIGRKQLDIDRNISLEAPSYCSGCGKDFPWTTEIEEAKQRDGKFISISDDSHYATFYQSMIRETNTCYQVKADHSAVIITRKIIENLLVDILRSVVGMNNVDVFYDTERRQTRRLSDLISEFSNRLDEMKNIFQGFLKKI